MARSQARRVRVTAGCRRRRTEIPPHGRHADLPNVPRHFEGLPYRFRAQGEMRKVGSGSPPHASSALPRRTSERRFYLGYGQFVGTRRFSSSNQFTTTLICVGAGANPVARARCPCKNCLHRALRRTQNLIAPPSSSVETFDRRGDRGTARRPLFRGVVRPSLEYARLSNISNRRRRRRR